MFWVCYNWLTWFEKLLQISNRGGNLASKLVKTVENRINTMDF